MVTAEATVCIISLVLLISEGEAQMTSLQGDTMDREQEGLMDREIRTSFNEMRGKSSYMDYENLYSQFGKRAKFNGMRGKRAPFNGMRGKRAPLNGMRGMKRTAGAQDILGWWNRYFNYTKMKRRPKNTGFVGMRG